MGEVYATAAQLLARYDARIVGDLCRDDDVRETAAAIATNARVLAALADASGQMDLSLRQADRYTAGDLATLNAADDPVLVQIACALALERLYTARGLGVPSEHRPSIEEAKSTLERLRTGIQTLDVATNRRAGQPQTKSRTTQQRIDQASMTAAPFFPRAGQTDAT